MIPWVKCEACGEFMCQVHGVHAHECECPGIDDWQEHGLWPYLECSREAVDALVIEVANRPQTLS